MNFLQWFFEITYVFVSTPLLESYLTRENMLTNSNDKCGGYRLMMIN